MINKMANPMFLLSEEHSMPSKNEVPSAILVEEDAEDDSLDNLVQMGDSDYTVPHDDLEEDLISTTVLGLDGDGNVEHKVDMSLEEDDVMSLLPNAQMAILGLDLDDVEEEMAEVHDEDESDSEMEKEKDWENDGDHTKFISYITMKLNDIPLHSGKTTVGCEKALAHLKRLDKELSRAIQSDEKNIIPEDMAEKLRDVIYDWVEKLEAARDKLMDKKYKKNKKNAFRVGKEVVARINDGEDIQYYVSVGNEDEETLLRVALLEPTPEQVTKFVKSQSLTKEAAGAGVVMVEDPFLHSLTRLLIQAHITQGKDMEEVYAHLKDKYDLKPREELCVHELLHQRGFPLIKDLGRIGEEIRQSDGKGVEHSTVYQG